MRRERYVGEWIPEPLPEPDDGTTADPADRITLDESVHMAFLVVLESMTPAERVAFILHDVFRYPFAEVADIVGRTPAACRQLASSARRRMAASRAPVAPAPRQAGLVRDFKRAWEAKDIPALIGLLDPDAVAVTDGGGRAPALLEPVVGAERIAQTWVALAGMVDEFTVTERSVNGSTGPGRRDRRGRGDGVLVRDRGRPDQAHLGGAQPGQAAALDRRVTIGID
nr:hypothetical protein GCM10020092_036320 [Actinoplanes digitatis]